MPTPEAKRIYNQARIIGIKYPMATTTMVCQAIGCEKMEFMNALQQHGATWQKITGWDQYRRSVYLRQHDFQLPDSARPGFEICNWVTRRLRPMKHLKIEYPTGIPV